MTSTYPIRTSSCSVSLSCFLGRCETRCADRRPDTVESLARSTLCSVFWPNRGAAARASSSVAEGCSSAVRPRSEGRQGPSEEVAAVSPRSGGRAGGPSYRRTSAQRGQARGVASACGRVTECPAFGASREAGVDHPLIFGSWCPLPRPDAARGRRTPRNRVLARVDRGRRGAPARRRAARRPGLRPRPRPGSRAGAGGPAARARGAGGRTRRGRSPRVLSSSSSTASSRSSR